MNNNIEINSEYSLEILNGIVEHMNRITSRINTLNESVSKINESQVWTCENAEELESKCSIMCNNFLEECKVSNRMVANLINSLESYEEIDKKVLQALSDKIDLL